MSHCRSPQTCSVCLALPAKRITLVDGHALVDGVPQVRVIDVPQNLPTSGRGRFKRRK